jgi:hypothetical protein
LKGKYSAEFMAQLKTRKGQWRNMLSITIRITRLRWAGHVRRMEEVLPGRIMYVTPIGQCKTGRPKTRREEVGRDARMLGIRSWWSIAVNRNEWW